MLEKKKEIVEAVIDESAADKDNNNKIDAKILDDLYGRMEDNKIQKMRLWPISEIRSIEK